MAFQYEVRNSGTVIPLSSKGRPEPSTVQSYRVELLRNVFCVHLSFMSMGNVYDDHIYMRASQVRIPPIVTID